MKYFQELVMRANHAVNSEEARNIKNKLLKISIIMMIVGYLGAFICFISFAVIGMGSLSSMGSGFGKILIPFVLIIPFSLVGGIGTIGLKLGLSIVVAKVTTNFLDTNSYCPNCGDVIQNNEQYCDKCGTPLLVKKVCKECQTENDMKASYCCQCGKKLR